MPKTLNAPKKREDDNDKESETYASRRDIAPLPAVRPPRQSTYECQDQEDDQDSSKHCFSFPSEFRCRDSGTGPQRRSKSL